MALGSIPGASDILGWTSAGLVNSYKFRNLSLTQCRQYYPSVRAVDRGGEASTAALESGFFYDQTPPAFNSALSALGFDGYYDRTVTVSWDNTKITDNCENRSYQFAVGTYAGGNNILNWKTFRAVSKKQIRDEELGGHLNLQRGTLYYTSLRVMDAGGNSSTPITSPAWYFYDPLEISGITFWADFSDYKSLFKDPSCSIVASAINDQVACVQDRSGGYGTLTNMGSPLPKLVANLDHEKIRLSMAGTYLASSPVSLNSIMMVHQHPVTNSGWNYLMDWRDSVPNSWWTPVELGGFWNGLFMNGSPVIPTPTAVFDNKLNISYMIGSSLFHNSGLHLGSRYTLNEFSHGEFSEIFIFNRVLSNSERQKLEGYLACKWGHQASLPSGHLYKSACPY